MNHTNFVPYMPPGQGRPQTIHHYVPSPPQPVTHRAPVQHQHQQQQQQQHHQPQQQRTQTPSQTPTPQAAPATTIAPKATYKQPAGPPAAPAGPILAQGDWTKNLVHLAKTAELKKHSLSLQLHTAHVLSANSQLETKTTELEELKEERTRLEAERTKLLNALREVNEERDKVDLKETKINDECKDIRAKIKELSEGEFAQVKHEVDTLRAELGQSPTPSLEDVIRDKKMFAFASDKRSNNTYIAKAFATPPSSTGSKRASDETAPTEPAKRPRGRPKGSKNKAKSSS